MAASNLPAAYEMEQTDWGYIVTIVSSPSYRVNLLGVKPNKAIPRARHQRRYESWRILDGIPAALIITNQIEYNAIKTFDIPPGITHSVVAGNSALLILEVQWGYYDPNDIEIL